MAVTRLTSVGTRLAILQQDLPQKRSRSAQARSGCRDLTAAMGMFPRSGVISGPRLLAK